MSNLASIRFKQGRWTAVEDSKVQLVKLYTAIQGPDHPDSRTSLTNLATTYWKQGQFAKAE
jgi:hypothetical protein